MYEALWRAVSRSSGKEMCGFIFYDMNHPNTPLILDQKFLLHDVYPETLQRCIGEMDKNHTLVFEGDTLYENGIRIGTVIWDTYDLSFYVENGARHCMGEFDFSVLEVKT